MKKLISALIACVLLFISVGPTFAATTTNNNTELTAPTVYQDNSIVTSDQLNSTDTVVQPAYNIGEFWGVVYTFILTTIAAELVTQNWTIFENWLINKVEKWGGDKSSNSDSFVKVNGHNFDSALASNCVGDGKANSSSRVTDLQVALTNLGYSVGTIDGIWGPKTKAAVVSFQMSRNLTADGIVGKNTWRKLAVK
ncbi:peptidoglycan-binding protein [Bacillus sp. MM2020_1]|nr:peptidoglycan-binding protein [Bacillus sp. MM2020_1]